MSQPSFANRDAIDSAQQAALHRLLAEMLQSNPFYCERLTCAGIKPRNTGIAPACAIARGLAPMTEVAKTTFINRPYDDNVSVGLDPGESITLVLYELRMSDEP